MSTRVGEIAASNKNAGNVPFSKLFFKDITVWGKSMLISSSYFVRLRAVFCSASRNMAEYCSSSGIVPSKKLFGALNAMADGRMGRVGVPPGSVPLNKRH